MPFYIVVEKTFWTVKKASSFGWSEIQSKLIIGVDVFTLMYDMYSYGK